MNHQNSFGPASARLLLSPKTRSLYVWHRSLSLLVWTCSRELPWREVRLRRWRVTKQIAHLLVEVLSLPLSELRTPNFEVLFEILISIAFQLNYIRKRYEPSGDRVPALVCSEWLLYPRYCVRKTVTDSPRRCCIRLQFEARREWKLTEINITAIDLFSVFEKTNDSTKSDLRTRLCTRRMLSVIN